MKYWQAINQALSDEMTADAAVMLIGEDSGAAGGAFGATSGLQDRFGEQRVRDTPISEAAIMGAALGAAMRGARPVVEIMFMDFLGLAMDQLVNQAAKVSYMSGGHYHAPMVVRTMCGAGRGTGPQHSQSFESWLVTVPGLKVVWPSCAADAYGLLRAAIRDEDPVVFIESLQLWGMRGDVDASKSVPLGSAAVARTGDDLTLVTWGAATVRALDAADAAASDGVGVEVVDLRTLQPLDWSTVLASARKTGRAMVVHDGPGDGGLPATIAARISRELHGELRGPVVVHGTPFAPAPFSRELEAAFYLTADDIRTCVLAAAER